GKTGSFVLHDQVQISKKRKGGGGGGSKLCVFWLLRGLVLIYDIFILGDPNYFEGHNRVSVFVSSAYTML
ncbi:hypothetical protein ACJX0J_033513, partial [Zea mays]